MGIPVAEVAGIGVFALELGGGRLVVLGAVTRLLAGRFAATLVVAAWLVQAPKGLHTSDGGWELVGLLVVVGVVLGLARVAVAHAMRC